MKYKRHLHISETKYRKLRDDELDFGEVLNREIYKRK